MLIRFLSGMLMTFVALSVAAQNPDSIQKISIQEVVVTASLQQRAQKNSSLPIEVVRKDAITKHFSGNLMKSLEHLPGIQSMSVGSGFSKPMIRGMAFNRVSVTENGIKQEGQQWGADHGLEIDAFNIEQVNVRKGPSSLLFGSDAIGGVVEILQPLPPYENKVFGSVDLLAGSVNGLMGASLMLGVKQNNWYAKARYSEQHFADCAVPTDTIVYLTQKLPIANRHLNNTAGFERSANIYTRYSKGRFSAALSVSNSYQKVGFFAGAHGIPDAKDVIDDGNKRDIDLPYSFVNHFKSLLNIKQYWGNVSLSWDLGYQNNHREEWSLFHTHYDSQEPPTIDPDKEFAFMLNNYSSGAKLKINHSSDMQSTISWDVQYQQNNIAGYSFLLPKYNRTSTGAAYVTDYKFSNKLKFSGGIRYDIGRINTNEYVDENLAIYLDDLGYSEHDILDYKVRSYAINRGFGDYSLSAGMVWNLNSQNNFRLNIGRSYRLPNANELAANGVHHGSFMHERGDALLDSEQGWQIDVMYEFSNNALNVKVSPFVSWYQNYIYLQPSGEWSILPHAGQIYNYSQSKAIFAGSELAANVKLPLNFNYEFSGEYIFTYNLDEYIPLSFSPPMSMRNKISWEQKTISIFAEWHSVAAQNRTARNEDPTPSAQLFNCGAMLRLPFVSSNATLTFSVENIFDTKYLNHLSFYRKVEIPEPGRNFQLSIKIPLENKLKGNYNQI